MPTQMFASLIMRVQRYGDRSACRAELISTVIYMSGKNQNPGRLYRDDARIWTKCIGDLAKPGKLDLKQSAEKGLQLKLHLQFTKGEGTPL